MDLWLFSGIMPQGFAEVFMATNPLAETFNPANIIDGIKSWVGWFLQYRSQAMGSSGTFLGNFITIIFPSELKEAIIVIKSYVVVEAFILLSSP